MIKNDEFGSIKGSGYGLTQKSGTVPVFIGMK